MEKLLVSVPVITYNSAKTVLETLESIKAQTYQNIELIISDDCSKDTTVEICRSWVEKNKERFVRTEIITAEKNTGVSANMNRAENACHGEWIKGIAGDDLLMPNCIQTYIEYVNKHPNAVYVFSKVIVFGMDQEKIMRFRDTIFDYSFFNLTPEQQYERMICWNFQPIPAATAFYNCIKTKELGLIFDERIPMLEDWPRWIQCLEAKVRFYFIDNELVKYRISESSICSGAIYSASFRRSLALMYIYYQFKPAIKYKGLYLAILKYIHSIYVVEQNFFWHVIDYIFRKTNRIFRKQDEFY